MSETSSKCIIHAEAYREGLGSQERARYLEYLILVQIHMSWLPHLGSEVPPFL